MTYRTKPIEFLDEQAIQVKNDTLIAVLVPGWGSNIISLTYKKKNLALLRTPENRQTYSNRPILFGIPILFPPNRIEDGNFTYANRTYVFDINEPEKHNHIHGFVHDKPWQLVSKDEQSVVTRFDSTNYPVVERQFPHHFTMEMAITLTENSMIQKLTITNHSDSSMPLGLGYHTSFVFRENSTVNAPVSRRWVLNERNLPVGEFVNVNSDIPVEQPLDDVFLVDSNAKNKLTILDGENKIRIDYLCDENFTQWVIYNGDAKSNLLCPEPYTWVTNAPNLDLPNSLTGFQALPPHESKTFTTEIIVSELDK